MINIKKNRKHDGMTLVEVMVALILASLIILAVISLFMSNYRNYRMSEGLSRIQDNGRYALEILNKNIRQAGFSGCRSVDNLNMQVITNSGTTFSAGDQILQGYESGMTIPTGLAPSIVPNTDAIIIRKTSSCGASLTGNLTAADANVEIFTPNQCGFASGDVVMVSDCEDAHIFSITNTPLSGSLAHALSGNQADFFCTNYGGAPGAGSCNTGVDKLYGSDAEVTKVESLIYYIRNNVAGVPSLYERNLDGSAAVELVEGVEDMEIQYGMDTVGSDRVIDVYVTADAVADWGQILGVRISLMMNSIADELVDPSFAPTTVIPETTDDGLVLTPAAADRQLRRVFSTTIGVRNALP